MDTNLNPSDAEEKAEAAAFEAFREAHFKRRRLRILLVLFATILLGVILKWVEP